MRYISLSKSKDWTLSDKHQNVIGWDVYDAAGARVGHVGDMIINTETGYVDTVVLTDGTKYPSHDIDIDRKAKRVTVDAIVPTGGVRTSEPVAPESTAAEPAAAPAAPEPPTSTPSSHVAPGAGADAMGADFQTHYEATYLARNTPYTTFYEPAYLFGYSVAADERFVGRDFDEAEADLAGAFEDRFPRRRFSDVRDAVRYGYTRRLSG